METTLAGSQEWREVSGVPHHFADISGKLRTWLWKEEGLGIRILNARKVLAEELGISSEALQVAVMLRAIFNQRDWVGFPTGARAVDIEGMSPERAIRAIEEAGYWNPNTGDSVVKIHEASLKYSLEDMARVRRGRIKAIAQMVTNPVNRIVDNVENGSNDDQELVDVVRLMNSIYSRLIGG